MPRTLKRNAIIVLALAIWFYWSFMFAKHNESLRNVIPFGVDPYDAVGSFGVVIGMILAMLALVRAFRPYRDRVPSIAQRVYLIRSQMAVVLVVMITLAVDIVAMARHRAWVNSPSRNELVALLAALALVGVAVQLLIRTGQRALPKVDSNRWAHAATAVLLAIFIVAVYPERLMNATVTHLFTIVMSAALLFAPMRPLLNALVPYDDAREIPTGTRPPHHRSLSSKHRWGIVLILGAVIGGFLVIGEMSEGGGTPTVSRLLFIASIFVGLAIAGFLIAYVFVGAPLGLTPRR